MGRRGAIRRMFPGGNTSRGFVSFFDWILPAGGCTFVLKGGPGTGKSTFMNRVAADVLAAGVDVEFHHCSADPDSVDAVAFPALGVAIIDGTAPHPVEPALYEVSGELVDLGPLCDRAAIRKQAARIEALSNDATEAFARAYRYLAAARFVQEDWEATNRSRVDEDSLRRTTARLLDQLGDDDRAVRAEEGGRGGRRRLFAGSITPDGPRHHLDSLLRPVPRKFVLTGEPGTGRRRVLQAVVDTAAARGLFIETFHCALDPDRIDHVIIPDLGAAVVSSVPPHEWVPDGPPDRAGQVAFIPLAADEEAFRPLADAQSRRAAAARRTFWQLFRQAIEALQEARNAHLALESCYAPHVDFDGVEGLRQGLRDRIMARVGAPSVSL